MSGDNANSDLENALENIKVLIRVTVALKRIEEYLESIQREITLDKDGRLEEAPSLFYDAKSLCTKLRQDSTLLGDLMLVIHDTIKEENDDRNSR